MRKINKRLCLYNTHLKANKYTALRCVLIAAEQTVFSDPHSQCYGSSALIIIHRNGLTSAMMQKIASSSTHPATVFLKQQDIKKRHCAIRWFNHSHEISRCGHGTLAAALFLKKFQGISPQGFYSNNKELFTIKSQRKQTQLQMTTIKSTQVAPLPLLSNAIKGKIIKTYQTAEQHGYITVLVDNRQPLTSYIVDIDELTHVANAVILLQQANITEQQGVWYFRYFAPYYGVNEDRATGSALSVIAPITEQLTQKKQSLLIQQSSTKAVIHSCLSGKSVIIH
ncbi:PhzF family phenazine biosynthesis protein [Pseudoalteromonas sp. KAN5]|uniref:PhzF family phenazine biosynthesis protein n=1 Tax=Pseudoalteromonas sp. KAN5 TaxID=2916633 RepID=UPI001FCAC90C|nr:PhzF family phenazine biosynthesis protein [Pseudoalteromonas sp. KAN5]BDF94386.1 hypothetical protein KAN5_12240 [Pseudoalteromonas sp. KAN5]